MMEPFELTASVRDQNFLQKYTSCLWSVLFGSTHLCQQLELDLTCAKQVRASERENMATVPERRGSELFFCQGGSHG